MKSVVFFTSEIELPWLSRLARGLELEGFACDAWIVGSREAELARSTGRFRRVLDLAAGFDRLAVTGPTEIIGRAREWEIRLDETFLHRDASADRELVGNGYVEWPPIRIAHRWTWGEIMALAVHVAESANRELEEVSPVALFSGTGSMIGRIVRRVARSHSVNLLDSFTLTHPGNRLFFLTGLDYEWDECIDLYRSFLSSPGPPSYLVEQAEAVLAEVNKPSNIYHAVPSVKQSLPRFSQRYGPGRLIGIWRTWDRARSREGISLPQCHYEEMSRPTARLSRKIRRTRILRDYEQIASRRIPDVPFLTYFLHSEPEITVDTFSFEHQDQIALVRNVASVLPADELLVVKEHSGNAGYRDGAFYRELMSIPGVVFMHHSADARLLIRSSRAVMTLTGTVAIEAICLGVPVLVFGSVYYQHFAGVTRVESFDHLREIIGDRSRLVPATHEEAIAALAARIGASYPGGWQYNGTEQVDADATVRTVATVLTSLVT